jgi:2-polyprenyl-3-methyl-5-hydroxy-6-metoxy-1,4-benzoquinol methylase
MTLKKIEPELLRKFYLECDPDKATPTLYFSQNRLIRWFFWLRLSVIVGFFDKKIKKYDTCLDFGGGGGEFLPTLSQYFENVTLLDLNTERASKVVDHFQLNNVVLEEKNIFDDNGTNETYTLIIAADVLEHFKSPDKVIQILRLKMNKNSVLITSLPTEGLIYIILRAILGIEKPVDHYFTAKEVEVMLEDAGFRKFKRTYLPLKFNLFALFSITAWSKTV